MRTSCTLFGPSSLVHSLAVVLEKAGFDATTLERDGNKHDNFPGPPMVTVVVLDRDEVNVIESHSYGVTHTTTESRMKVKGRRGRPRKQPLAAPTEQDYQPIVESAPEPGT
jgi:hypothetical protein